MFVISLLVSPIIYFGVTAILKEILHESAARILAMLIVVLMSYNNLPEEMQWTLLSKFSP